MPRFKLKAKDSKLIEKVVKAFEESEIIQRQKEMTAGRWDFVVFAPLDKKQISLRKGFVEHSKIQRAPLYIASLSDPSGHDAGGIPIEEFISEDIPEEYEGLEIIHIDPVRPLTIEKKEVRDNHSKFESEICKQFENENIAILRAPKDADWMMAVMKYLHECDKAFPDQIQQAFFENFRQSGNSSHGKYLN
ncbi:MAG: hypothetical protein G3M78_11355 [Candidatus Nitrohelix vancouverensis]|uniref:Uncharacterized protein n=1 Tax=Candidatus Nitrohelix vancouverensis TaxID=2705534 RepID=A0A7T0C3N5_9BACT|nr:MAG: hypothetical protein G3M78_11355 [Candidatus Nitrohelix vancouverensis]